MPEPSSESAPVQEIAPVPEPISCPPPAERVPESAVDPRSDLLRLAATLAHTRSQRLLIEYLRLRRAAR